jgi:hypothetical protein
MVYLLRWRSFLLYIQMITRSHNRYRVDALNNIYVSGVTNSNNNISTPGAYKENQSRWLMRRTKNAQKTPTTFLSMVEHGT